MATTATQSRRHSSTRWQQRILRSILSTLAHLIYLYAGLSLNGSHLPFAKRGFFCDDTTIGYPFKADTVGTKTLFFIALIVPFIVIKGCDAILRKNLILVKRRLVRKTSEKVSSSDDEELIYSGSVFLDDAELDEDAGDDDVEVVDGGNDNAGDKLISPTPTERKRSKRSPLANDSAELNLIFDDEQSNSPNTLASDDKKIRNINSDESCLDIVTRRPLKNNNFASSEASIFLFGFSTTMFITGIGKMAAGRLRPHFFARCKPNVNCMDPAISMSYIEKFECTSPKFTSADLAYITTSWPSGHASLIFFSMLYLVIYLNNTIPSIILLKKLNYKYNPLMLYTLFVTLISIALYITLTRVSDYHHHPTDVFCGTVIGTVISLATSKLFFQKISLQRLLII